MTFLDFCKVVRETPRHRYIREGQHAFNLLSAFNPELADKIRGTDVDPYDINSRMPAFWRAIEEQG